MTVPAGFLIYAALYRLTVLTVGALSIWLGFRLFSNASGSKGKTVDNAGSASAEAGRVKLAFTNLLPGTYFALFGTAIIGIMLWRGEPQFLQQELKELTGNSDSRTVETTVMRGIIEFEWKKLDKPGITLAEAAETMGNIAKLLRQEHRIGEALSMAKLAVLYGKEEDKAKHLDLLAELLRKNGHEEEAVKTEQAAESLRRPEK
ncbi:hypothetical protein [Candidatus Electronema sp. PJ]|uniref:hypothetical protein n=1 Tax=Candidatus Electronema sp. PJ TaxID=3401572 RepID=UPI003AA88AA7